MTHELSVKEHLRNSMVYQPASVPVPGKEWKRRLLCRYSLNRQIKTALQERKRLIKWFVYVGVPVLCIAFSFTVYFELPPMENWIRNIEPILNFEIPPIGLKEVLIFIAAVNVLTFLSRKRIYSL